MDVLAATTAAATIAAVINAIGCLLLMLARRCAHANFDFTAIAIGVVIVASVVHTENLSTMIVTVVIIAE
jgi:hypothetical protein